MNIKNTNTKNNAPLLNSLLNQVAKKGRLGDDTLRYVKGELSHVNEFEANMIDNHGDKGEDFVSAIGAGTTNPKTGMKEYSFTIGLIGTLVALGLLKYSAEGFQGFNPNTKKFWSEAKGATEGLGRPTDFGAITDFYGKKGKFEGLEGLDMNEIIKSMRFHEGGYSGQKTGAEWKNALAQNITALREFDPMKMLRENLQPFITEQRGAIKRGSQEAVGALKDLYDKQNIGDTNIGRFDLFGKGAGAAGLLEEQRQTDLASQRLKSEGDVAHSFSQLWG